MIGAISHKALHGCTLHLDDGELSDASVFPLFDDRGRTQELMLVSSESPRIALCEFGRGQFSRPYPWRKRLALSQSNWRDCTGEEAERLSTLWHFDPWWELAADRYSGHDAVSSLKATNLPGFASSITRVWFAPDLSRVRWVEIGKGENSRIKRFRPGLLHPAGRQRGGRIAVPGVVTESGWVLRPWW